MKAQCPNEDIDAFTAHIYMLAGDEKQAYENYMKADINKLDKTGLNEFVRCSYFTGHFEDALRAAEAGIKMEPRNPTFNRLAMFSNYELKNYDAAKSYINKYFNETDSAKFSEYDHFYTALIYQALDEKANMYEHYNKALELVNDSSMIKRWDIQKAIADSYLKDQEFENAIKYYNDMLGSKPNVNFDDWEGLANIYSKYGDAVPAKKAEMIQKAVDLFREAGQKFPIQQVYATYMAANNVNKLDDNMKNSLAKPDYLKLIELLGNKTDRSKGEDTMLKTAYHYMMFNSYINKNVPGAKEYAEKILAIDPEYKPALEIQNLK
jgi:tetratricopeptide (TPR) repeat protein